VAEGVIEKTNLVALKKATFGNSEGTGSPEKIAGEEEEKAIGEKGGTPPWHGIFVEVKKTGGL